MNGGRSETFKEEEEEEEEDDDDDDDEDDDEDDCIIRAELVLISLILDFRKARPHIPIF